MIETVAIVTRCDSGWVWVKAQSDGACGSCVQQASCGTASLDKWLPRREFAIACPLAVQVGDKVRVIIDDGLLLTGSLLAYGAPLLLMLLAVIGLPLLWPALLDWQPELAMSSLLLAFWLLHQAGRRGFYPSRFQPKILGRC